MLIRKARKVGRSMVLTLPSQIVKMLDISERTLMKIEKKDDTIIIKKHVELRPE